MFAIFASLEVLVHGGGCDNVKGLEGCACRMNGYDPISLQELVGNNTDGNPIR